MALLPKLFHDNPVAGAEDLQITIFICLVGHIETQNGRDAQIWHCHSFPSFSCLSYNYGRMAAVPTVGICNSRATQRKAKVEFDALDGETPKSCNIEPATIVERVFVVDYGYCKSGS